MIVKDKIAKKKIKKKRNKKKERKKEIGKIFPRIELMHSRAKKGFLRIIIPDSM